MEQRVIGDREVSALGFGCWAIEPLSGGPVAGTVLFKPLPNGVGEVEVGWHLHPDSWGNGYATESARALVASAFADGVPRVHAVVKPGNLRVALRHIADGPRA